MAPLLSPTQIWLALPPCARPERPSAATRWPGEIDESSFCASLVWARRRSASTPVSPCKREVSAIYGTVSQCWPLPYKNPLFRKMLWTSDFLFCIVFFKIIPHKCCFQASFGSCVAKKQTNKQTNKHKQANKQTNKQAQTSTNKQTSKQESKQASKQASKQTHKETKKQCN